MINQMLTMGILDRILSVVSPEDLALARDAIKELRIDEALADIPAREANALMSSICFAIQTAAFECRKYGGDSRVINVFEGINHMLVAATYDRLKMYVEEGK